jgi:hypothetical protein
MNLPMNKHAPMFFDSAWYCYANCAAMLLSARGEEISPRLIEALSAVGLGASSKHGVFFFGELTTPDKGLSQALTLLGFQYEEGCAQAGEIAPLAHMETLLDECPVILGPLDMSHLVYNPMRPKAPGADHYVLACQMQGAKVCLHDPAGFAHVSIDQAHLAAAWRADSISYKRGSHRYWTKPIRCQEPTPSEIYQGALGIFQDLYRQAEQTAAREQRPIGRDALLTLAKDVSDQALSQQQRGHLIFFALPLGAKRALDYAAFFGERHQGLRQLKLEQAKAFGACHSSLMQEAWLDAGKELAKLADMEAAIKEAIMLA